ncbi:MAG: CoA ester lyase [Pseudonocardiaceae bacterium]|nr:CoA ester lyase [Pseudonocardiaceae bacterium]
MVAKVVRSSPDAAVVDLEDAVAPSDKETARRTAVDAIADLEVPRGTVVLLRVNPPGSPWFADDVAAAADSAASGVVLPKLEAPAQLAELRRELADRGRGDAVVVAGMETARGVDDCRELLSGGVDAAYFGAEDYIADLGGRRTPGGEEVLYARSRVCLAARLAEVAGIDQVVVAVHDDERFIADAEQARAMGFQGKICIHPRQVDLAHRVFTPSAEEVERARAVLAAGRDGVGVVDGQMIDDVHLRMATAVLHRAGQRCPQPPGSPPR